MLKLQRTQVIRHLAVLSRFKNTKAIILCICTYSESKWRALSQMCDCKLTSYPDITWFSCLQQLQFLETQNVLDVGYTDIQTLLI